MKNGSNMSAPITRGELRDELSSLRSEFHQAIAPLATKAELQAAIAPLATKAEVALLATKAEVALLATKAEVALLATKAEVALLATKAEVKSEMELWARALMKHMDQLVHTEMAQHARAFQEWTQSMVASFDDKYNGLPPRVEALESAVFRKEPR